MGTIEITQSLYLRLLFVVVAILASVLVAVLIYFGVVTPHPNTKTAYLISLGIGVAGLIQLILALFIAKQT